MAKADMFLKLEGKKTGVVKGEANAPDHPEEIEVFDWSWGMTGPQGLGGAGATSRVALSEIRISKWTDRATTSLMSVMRSNELIKGAVLSVRKSGVSPPIDYLVISIANGRITSHTIGTATPGKPELVETLSIAFEEIEVKYAEQRSTGSKSAEQTFSARVV